MTHTAAVQTVLTLAGFWDGPVDGVWTDELTAALQQFQLALGVEPTGIVDAATLAAFQQVRDAALAPPVPATTGAPERPSAPAPTAAPAPPPPAPTTAVATTTATTAAPGREATVVVADSDLGPILTTGDGMTLYLFTPDAQGVPTCVDDCAGAWPPLLVDDAGQLAGGDGVDATLLGTVEHPGGGLQVTYNRWPLYGFSGDARPGDTNGQGLEGVWYVLDATGTSIGSG